ncbi:MAG: hypothetical protein LCH59_13650 [Proteobacteria bacterium]|nr:hypothetical protein [Pseudomonadota bacterium]
MHFTIQYLTKQGWALTIHSSRPYFARRLNSGVRLLRTLIAFIASTAIGLATGVASACCVVDLRLPASDVQRLATQAKQGDRSAMWRLYQHYDLTPDAWNHAYWGERLARLNDKRVLLSLADFYDTLGTPALCKRAIELAEQHAALSDSDVEREGALQIARHYTGQELPLGRCGREQQPNNSFKPTPLRGAS